MSQALPLLLEPLALPGHLDPARFRLVDLSRSEQYQLGHIPGAVHVPPSATSAAAPTPGLLPDAKQLQALFGSLGHHPELHYIVYDDEGGGWAGRFIWLLDSIGHRKYSYLDGGLHAWQQQGLPSEQETQSVTATLPHIRLDKSVTIDVEELLSSLNKPDLLIWDARSPEEFRGEKALANKAGHIPGAVNFEWTAGMDKNNGWRLRQDLAEQLQALGITPDRDIVTHCQTHHRSGFTYLAAKILGYPRIRAYAGSWSEWGNHPNTPVES